MEYYILEWGCIIVAAVISLLAQLYINFNFSRYSKKTTSNGITGSEAARRILDNNGLQDVSINGVRGNLTDFYDPRNKSVNLSESIYQKQSIAAVAVSAHECGHAIQDKNGYLFLRIRKSIAPVVKIASYAGYFSILIGFFLSLIGLVRIGIAMEIIILLFQIITLPVEFNASNRALKQIKELGLLDENEYKGGRKMLVSAALTYVAGVASAILQIIRLLLIVNSRRRD